MNASKTTEGRYRLRDETRGGRQGDRGGWSDSSRQTPWTKRRKVTGALFSRCGTLQVLNLRRLLRGHSPNDFDWRDIE
jgi:hypothetical protein